MAHSAAAAAPRRTWPSRALFPGRCTESVQLKDLRAEKLPFSVRISEEHKAGQCTRRFAVEAGVTPEQAGFGS
jgi:hypothetical protein